jgi:hypothetical protein
VTFCVRPDGSIEVQTADQAIAVSRAMLDARQPKGPITAETVICSDCHRTFVDMGPRQGEVRASPWAPTCPVAAMEAEVEADATAVGLGPPGDWLAPVGSPPWWAAFHQKYGRDPTPEEMTAAAKSALTKDPT